MKRANKEDKRLYKSMSAMKPSKLADLMKQTESDIEECQSAIESMQDNLVMARHFFSQTDGELVILREIIDRLTNLTQMRNQESQEMCSSNSAGAGNIDFEDFDFDDDEDEELIPKRR